MNDFISFLAEHKYFTAIAVLLNIVLIRFLTVPIISKLKANVIDATGGRYKSQSYSRYLDPIMSAVKAYDKKEKPADIYSKARSKLKKAGYKSEYAAAIYLILKYPGILLASLITLISTYPSIHYSIAIAIYLLVLVELIIKRKTKHIASTFENSIYKLYKYLHNQISSGIQPGEAVKSVYEIVDNTELKDLLILLSAKYSRTNDIDAALENFKSNFSIHEADAFCVAIKQGIETGDNAGILQRQEAVMFKKYFNMIQAETDACRSRSIIATAFFIAIIVIMLAVPMFNDVIEGIGKIFIN